MAAHPTNESMDRLLELRDRTSSLESKLRRARTYGRWFRFLCISIPAVLALEIAATSLFGQAIDMAPFWSLGAIFMVPAAIAAIVVGVQIFEHELGRAHEIALELDRLFDEQALVLSGANVSLQLRQYVYRGATQRHVSSIRRRGDQYRRVNTGFQALIIVGSLATTTVASLNPDDGIHKWLAVALSFAVGLAAGFTGYFKYRERAFYLRQTADDLEEQLNAYELGLYPYEHLDEAERIAKLVARLETIRVAQQQREQQLDQPKGSGAEDKTS